MPRSSRPAVRAERQAPPEGCGPRLDAQAPPARDPSLRYRASHPASLSGEALCGTHGRLRHPTRGATRDRRGASPRSARRRRAGRHRRSAAATSSAASRARAQAWTAPRATTWACSATVINSLGAAGRAGAAAASPRACMTAIEITPGRRAVHPPPRRSGTSRSGCVVIFAAGTGNPYFSTDTAAALRAMEVHAEAALQGDQGRGRLRPSDPVKLPDATMCRSDGVRSLHQRSHRRDGLHGGHALPRQQHAHPRVQADDAGQHQARGFRRARSARPSRAEARASRSRRVNHGRVARFTMSLVSSDAFSSAAESCIRRRSRGRACACWCDAPSPPRRHVAYARAMRT